MAEYICKAKLKEAFEQDGHLSAYVEGGMSMSYLLFIVIGYFLVLAGARVGVMVDDTTWLCIAILTSGEVISWRCKK